jgi:hypothetical protein
MAITSSTGFGSAEEPALRGNTRTHPIHKMPRILEESCSIAKLCEKDSAMKMNELAELSAYANVAEERRYRMEV